MIINTPSPNRLTYVVAVLIIAVLTLYPVISLGQTVGRGPTTVQNKKVAPVIRPNQYRPVSVWLTTPDRTRLLTTQPGALLKPDSGPDVAPTIDINSDTTYQQMDGFGASLTDSSAWLIYKKMTSSQRADVMTRLFDSTRGIGLSYLRQPIGANDFSLTLHSYDDMPAGQTDPTLSAFSIAYDTDYIIPALKQALQINPKLKIIASPWSPPGWMKSSGSLIGGTLNSSAYGAWANYFVKFLKAYNAQGVPIYAITPQNEPQYQPPDYPGMLLNAGDESMLVGQYLGPALQTAGLSSRLFVWDHNWDQWSYPVLVLNDPVARPFIAGSAFHAYAGNYTSMNDVHNAHPDKDLYFTEITAGEWSTDFGSNLKWDMQNLIIGAVRNWSKTVIKYNIALDENHGPHTGGCTNCDGLVTINQSTGQVSYNYDFYSLGHASKFVQPGAYRIESPTFGNGSIEDVAFKNPDGSIALIVLNSSSASKQFKVRTRGQSFNYVLPAGSVATFKWLDFTKTCNDTTPCWNLVWNDEFNGPDGSAVDPQKWTFDLGGNGWGNNELETYTNRLNNVFQQNGNLVIKVINETFRGSDGITKNYTSARLKTQGVFSQAYGRVEARIKIPFGQGIWPAFWMLGNNITTVNWPTCGEIDIMENVGREPTTVHGTIHGPGYSGASGIGTLFSLPSGQRFADDFHVYAIEWDLNDIRWYVDDVLYEERTVADLPAGTTWVYDHPFFVLLNVAVGGGFPGNPDSTSVFPQTMLVDYVRLYERTP